MTKRSSAAIIAILAIGFIAPTGAVADQRCTPIAHVLDASKIPGNESRDPHSQNPDERYKDAAGLNCIPTYELDFAGALGGKLPPEVYQEGKCDPESSYDQVAASIKADPNWYASCRRLKFTMGPLSGRPGMNDSLIHVTSFEHPMYDGYTLRWKPGLQSVDGSVPPVENVHLHHGTWIGGVNGPSAVTGPFFATGEEQTILQFPKGYGWTMKGQSAWAMLYMIHNATPRTENLYITYDIDYIAKPDADLLQWQDADGSTRTGLRDLKSIWMDAGAGGSQRTWDGSPASTKSYSSVNPIFNAQRGFGHVDTGAFWGLTGTAGSPLQTKPIQNNAGTGDLVCTFPRENCAAFDSSQTTSAQQGVLSPKIIGNATGPSGFVDCPQLGLDANGNTKKCAVLINMGGHLHPGGLRDEVAVLRDGEIRPILISDAVYWGGPNFGSPSLGGAPPNSWDMSMTGQLGAPVPNGRAKSAWKILIQPGDQLILNGVYDTETGSSYDQMAIVMSWMSPGYEADAIDPFAEDVIFDAGWTEGPGVTPRPQGLPAAIDVGCTPGKIPAGEENAGKTVLCLRGNVTHGSMPSRQHHADCNMTATCRPIAPATDLGIPLADTTITMQGFHYGQLDQTYATAVGITKIPAGTELTFYNPDTAGMIWHTITSCPAPCTGTTSASYPFPASGDTPVDFDSTILCVGLGCSTAGTTEWDFTVPDSPGVHTFFCRIHPFMRGVFEVV